MDVYLVDGTYELFRHYYALPSRLDADGNEVGAMLGVAASIVSMLRDGATHIGVATDHTVESFRNQMYDGYKTGDGIDPDLWRQFHPLEELLRALGVVVWPMVEQEADDGLAAAAARAAEDQRVNRVLICTPDKDLAQCVRGARVLQLDRRRSVTRDEDGVREKFGVSPASIPDYLALTGDAADGFPGVPRWGAKSAATALSHYGSIEAIPTDADEWGVKIRGAAALAGSLRENWEHALLFKDLATLRTDAPVFDDVDELLWTGPSEALPALCDRLGSPDLATRAAGL